MARKRKQPGNVTISPPASDEKVKLREVPEKEIREHVKRRSFFSWPLVMRLFARREKAQQSRTEAAAEAATTKAGERQQAWEEVAVEYLKRHPDYSGRAVARHVRAELEKRRSREPTLSVPEFDTIRKKIPALREKQK